jgi:hypothetical protein
VHGADFKASGVDNFEQVEGFLLAGKIGGEKDRAIVAEFAARVPPGPVGGAGDDVVAVLVLEKLSAGRNGVLEE